MAHRMACQHPDIVSAAISVGGPLEVPCTNSSAVPVMHWHGTLDPLFPWYGGIYHSVPYTMGVWRDNNRCNDEGEEDWLDLGILRTTWQLAESQRWSRLLLRVVVTRGLLPEQHQKRRCGLGLQISLNEETDKR